VTWTPIPHLPCHIGFQWKSNSGEYVGIVSGCQGLQIASMSF
jgi:hypothetical protein